jgi:hypothetical protein
MKQYRISLMNSIVCQLVMNNLNRKELLDFMKKVYQQCDLIKENLYLFVLMKQLFDTIYFSIDVFMEYHIIAITTELVLPLISTINVCLQSGEKIF